MKFRLLLFRLLFLIFSLFLWPNLSKGQLEIIPEIGSNLYALNGINDFDSIRSTINNSEIGEITVGVVLRKRISNKLFFSTRLTYRPNTVQVIVFNFQSQCIFCPVEKISSFAPNSFLINPNLELEFKSQSLPFQLSTHIGFVISLNRSPSGPTIDFNNRHIGVAEVINALSDAVKPITLAPTIGINLVKQRFQISVYYQSSSSFTNEILLFGEKHQFINSWEFLSFSIGYKFYAFPKWKKE